MKRFKNLPLNFAFFLGIILISGILLFGNPTPAFAQETNDPGFLDYLANSIQGDKKTFDAIYNENFASLKSLGCWGCTVFDTFASSVFSAGHSVAVSSKDNLISVIVAVASLFSLFYIGSSFVSGDASDLLGRWKVFWKLMIAVTIGSAVLQANAFDFAWNFIYNPIMQIPLAAADAVPKLASQGEACGGGSSPANMPSGAGRVMTEMREVVCGGHSITMKGLAFGLALAGTGDGFVGSIMNALVGIMVMIVFLWVAISFPLRFIDVLLRLTVVGIVTPILVVCAVFRPTRGYVQIGISNVLHAGALFGFTSIMFNIGGKFFQDAVDSRVSSLGAGNDGVVLSQSITLIASAVIFAAMLRMAPALASEFSQFRGQSGGVGDAATSFTSSVVTLPVKGAAAAGATVIAGRQAGKSMSSAAGAGAGGAANSLGKSVTGAN